MEIGLLILLLRTTDFSRASFVTIPSSNHVIVEFAERSNVYWSMSVSAVSKTCFHIVFSDCSISGPIWEISRPIGLLIYFIIQNDIVYVLSSHDVNHSTYYVARQYDCWIKTIYKMPDHIFVFDFKARN